MTRWLSLIALLLVAVSGCGGDTPSRNNDFTPLTSIQIVASPATIVTNTSIQLRAIGNFSGLFTRDVTNEVTWSSSDEAIASFALRPGTVGRVQGVAAGTATLTADYQGTVSANLDLPVVDATLQAISVSPVDPTVAAGQTQAFTASGHFDDGSAAGIDQDLTYDVSWSSSDTAVVTISNTAATVGQATGVAEGTATITAAPAWSTITGSTSLTVAAAAVQSIAVTPGDAALLSLRSRQYTATATLTDGNTSDITSQATWSSATGTVASVDTSGLVSGLAEGSTTISASLDGVTGSTSLQVTGGNLTGITVTPANPVLNLNTRQRLIATGSFSNGTQRDISRNVTWSLTVPTLASISNDGDTSGTLQASGIGNGDVQAVSGSVTGTTTLTVHDGILQSLTIDPLATENLLVGTSRQITVSGTFSNQDTQILTESVVWSSAAPAVAQFSTAQLLNGTLVGQGAGTADLQASLLGVDSPTVPITVTDGTAVGLTLTPANPTTTAGGQIQFTARADFGGGVSRDVTRDAVWTVSNENVAVLAHSVLLPGLVYGVQAGTATITADFGGQTAQITLTVQ